MKTLENILNALAYFFIIIIIGNNGIVFFNVQDSVYKTANPLIIKTLGVLSIFILPTLLDLIRRKSDEAKDTIMNLITGISLSLLLLLIDLLFKSRELSVLLFIVFSLALILHKK